MKTCFKCKKEKAPIEFYRHQKMGDGRLGKCKDCTRNDVSNNYRKNRKHYARYEKERFQKADRKAYALARQHIYRTTYPEKYRAHTAVGNAVRDGRLVKQACEKCGHKAQAHHDDYRKPLEVRWLCRKHHLEHHGKESY